jgi:hypothetical protein
MNEERLPHKILVKCPPGSRRKGRALNSWMQELTIGMREKAINSIEGIEREEWRRKIKLKFDSPGEVWHSI